MASHCHLKIQGADGESEDKQHKDWIDVHSWSWGAMQPETADTGGGMGAARVSLYPLSITAPVFKGANTAFLYCCCGEHIPTVELHMSKAGTTPQTYLKIKLEDAIISNVQFGAGSAEQSDASMVTISIKAKKNNIWYAPQGKDGKLTGGDNKGWDIGQNCKL